GQASSIALAMGSGYIKVTIGYYVQSHVQATIYLIISSFLFVMSMWSLAKTLFTKVGRVPLE
ncbi:hypothetical protein, partial [Citrobacter youngae]|uniref:hypothetical protein n=1 Tax=Citrobacter youngae TaxID=133448 RepID=UPI001953FAEF